MNIARLVLEQARSAPDEIAIRYPSGRDAHGRIRHGEARNRDLDRASDRIAHALEAVGIVRGTRTVLMVPPGLEFFTLMLGLFKIGAIPVLVDPGIGPRRLRRCLREVEPEGFIGSLRAQAARIALGWGRRTIRVSVASGRWPFPTGLLPSLSLDALCKGASGAPYPVAAMEDTDEAAILFTSGSTGPPKGVVYRHGNFAAQIAALRELGRIAKGEVDLSTFAPFALFDPALGMTAVIPEMNPTRPGSVDPRRILEPAETFGATNLFGSPALLDTVGRYGAEHHVKLSTLRRVVSAGAPVAASVMARFLEMLPEGAEVLTPYGATECLPVSCISSREVLAETAIRTAAGAGICVGSPVPSMDVRILAIDDRRIESWDPALELPCGEIGEITVRGPQTTTAYYNRPDATALAKIRDPDGSLWHRMGDVGYLDARGRLWYCGRKADRVRTASGTLYSIPCEAIFDSHPKVRRSALVGVPGTGGESIPVLCVELASNVRRRSRAEIEVELLALAARHDTTRAIERILYHRRFPVDIRHNAKIDRPELARWAARRRRRGRRLGLRLRSTTSI